MEEIIKKAREWALEEIRKNGTPAIEHFELSNRKGRELAGKSGADKDIVMLGTILMDIKLGECLREGNVQEHTARGADAAKAFLKDFDLDRETKDRIINCIEAHHGTKGFTCKEAEVCANADCYRFIHPTGVFSYLKLLGKRFDEFADVIGQAEMNMEEKHKILSLDICRQELEGYYQMFRKLFDAAK